MSQVFAKPIDDWYSTNVRPNSPLGHVTGWKLHSVAIPDGELSGKGFVALCGLMPRHGWGVDLFVTDKCKKCLKRLGAS